MPRQATRAGQKKPLTEAQKAALAKGQAARKRNLAARRASHGRQAASSQVASLPSLARDALSRQPDESLAPDASASSTASSASSSRSKLSQAEQDALLFSFVMDEDNEQDAAAAAPSEPGKKSGVGDKLARLLTADKTKPTGNQEEDDAQQAAEQWKALGSILFIFVCGKVFGADLAPSEDQAAAMSAPLCRILMRHITPLRQASADAYDVSMFAGACLVYYYSISPKLAVKRAERKVLNASAKTQEQPAAASGGSDTVQRGNVRILHPEDTPGRRRYDGEPAEDRDSLVRQDEHEPNRRDAGAAIISETLGVEL